MEVVDKVKASALAWMDDMEAVLIKQEINLLRLFTQKTGLKQIHGVLIGTTALFVFLMTNFGGKAVTNLIGFVYPTLASFQAVKSKNVDDDAFWLTYWIVFGLFQLLEAFGDLFLFWIPFYTLSKCLILIWMFSPHTRGAVYLFKQFVAPAVNRHQADIDGAIDAAKTFRAQMESEVIQPVASQMAHKISESAMDIIANQLRQQAALEGEGSS